MVFETGVVLWGDLRRSADLTLQYLSHVYRAFVKKRDQGRHLCAEIILTGQVPPSFHDSKIPECFHGWLCCLGKRRGRYNYWLDGCKRVQPASHLAVAPPASTSCSSTSKGCAPATTWSLMTKVGTLVIPSFNDRCQSESTAF